MQKHTFIVSFSDIAFRCVLVLAGLLAVPVPAVLLLFGAADLSSGYTDDDSAFFWACGLLVATAVVYLVFVVPVIWRKRFFRAAA